MTNPAVRAFFADPTGEAKKYDLIIASPSVSTGMSIQAGVVDVVCGELSSHVGTPHDGAQMLMRARGVSEIHVWVDDRKNAKTTDRNAILGVFWNGPDDDGNMCSDDDDGLGGVERDYAEMYLDVVVESNRAINRYAEMFWELIDNDGFTVLDGDSAPDARTIERHGREAAKILDVRGHLEARDLTDEEDAVLERRPEGDLTQAELLARKRHRLKRFYRLPEQPTDDELLAVYVTDGGETLRRQLHGLELAAATPDAVDEMMTQQRGTLAPLVVRHDHQHAAYKHTLKFAGIDLDTWQLFGVRYDAEALREKWIKPLESTWNVYRVSVPGWPELEAARKDPVRAFGQTLRSALGLGQRAVRNESGRQFQISAAHLERLRYWLERRARLVRGKGEAYPRAEWDERTMRQVNAHIKSLASAARVSTADETDETGKHLYIDSAIVSPVSTPKSSALETEPLDDYERLRCAITAGALQHDRNAPALLEYYRLADAGDETAKNDINAYLQDRAVRQLVGVQI